MHWSINFVILTLVLHTLNGVQLKKPAGYFDSNTIIDHEKESVIQENLYIDVVGSQPAPTRCASSLPYSKYCFILTMLLSCVSHLII